MNKFEKLFSTISSDVDCVLITSDINRRYFSGMKSSAGYVIAFRNQAYLLIDFRYIEKAKASVTNCKVELLTDFKKQACELFDKNKVKNIAIESDTLTVSQLKHLQDIFPEYNVLNKNELSKTIRDLRSVKTDEELEKIKKAQEIAEEAFEHILKFIKVGVTEKEIALELDFYMLRHGAEALSFDTIALTGKNTSLPHGVPGDTKVCDGDFVLMDYGAVYDGYHSDMTRTVCVGNPSDKQKKIYNIVLDAQCKTINAVKKGIVGKELDAVARNIITDAGYGEYFGHGLGHGVGMEIHEYPNANMSSKTVFENNMVVTVEPGIYLPGEFGVRIEDFVIIDNDSCKNITKCQKNLITL